MNEYCASMQVIEQSLNLLPYRFALMHADMIWLTPTRTIQLATLSQDLDNQNLVAQIAIYIISKENHYP